MPEYNCKEKILSEDYVDLIIPDFREEMDVVIPENQACLQDLGFGYRAVHIEESLVGRLSFELAGYNGIPNCYALLDTGALNETGIVRCKTILLCSFREME